MTERERYEKWMRKTSPSTELAWLEEKNRYYYGSDVQGRWEAWQARAANEAELVEALRKYHDGIDAIYNDSEIGRKLVLKYLGYLHPKAAHERLLAERTKERAK